MSRRGLPAVFRLPGKRRRRLPKAPPHSAAKGAFLPVKKRSRGGFLFPNSAMLRRDCRSAGAHIQPDSLPLRRILLCRTALSLHGRCPKKALSGRFFVPEQRYAPAGLPQRKGAYSAGQPAAAENPAFCRTALSLHGRMPEKSALRTACRSRTVSCRRGLPQRRRRYSDNGRDCGRCCFCGDLFSPAGPQLRRTLLSPPEGAFRAAAEEACPMPPLFRNGKDYFVSSGADGSEGA